MWIETQHKVTCGPLSFMLPSHFSDDGVPIFVKSDKKYNLACLWYQNQNLEHFEIIWHQI